MKSHNLQHISFYQSFFIVALQVGMSCSWYTINLHESSKFTSKAAKAVQTKLVEAYLCSRKWLSVVDEPLNFMWGGTHAYTDLNELFVKKIPKLYCLTKKKQAERRIVESVDKILAKRFKCDFKWAAPTGSIPGMMRMKKTVCRSRKSL